MHRSLSIFSLVALLTLLSGCNNDSGADVHASSDQGSEDFAWNVPANIPLPLVDADNPMSEAKFQLGRHLFYDARLSGNGTMSCSSCHDQAKAFTDGRTTAIGSTGMVHPRNAQSLTNAAYNATLTWGNPSLLSIEQQVFIPLFGDNPIEHDLTDSNWPTVIDRLKSEAKYTLLFNAAFPGESEQFTRPEIIKALTVFVRGLTSYDSAYDRHLAGDDSAYGASEQRGQKLFFGEQLECFHCHGGYNFSDSTADRTMSFINRPFHNTGLYNIGGSGQYPPSNRGIFEVTGKASDMGRFRAPSLRNIEKTAPYMHDGSIATLEEVVDFYSAGGRNITAGALAGDGRKNPYKDGFVTGFRLNAGDKEDLIAFLKSLTDHGFLTNPRFSNPW